MWRIRKGGYTPLGIAAKECWEAIPEHHPNVRLDEFTIMPDHLHGIPVLTEHGLTSPFMDRSTRVTVRGGKRPLVSRGGRSPEFYQSISPSKGSLSVVVRTFKAAVTTWARENGHPEF